MLLPYSVRRLVALILSIFFILLFSFSVFSYDIYYGDDGGEISVDCYDRESQWMKTETFVFNDPAINLRSMTFDAFCSGGIIYGFIRFEVDLSDDDTYTLIKLDISYDGNFVSTILVPRDDSLEVTDSSGLIFDSVYLWKDSVCSMEFSVECQKGNFEYYDQVDFDFSFADMLGDVDFYDTPFFHFSQGIECFVGEEYIEEIIESTPAKSSASSSKTSSSKASATKTTTVKSTKSETETTSLMEENNITSSAPGDLMSSITGSEMSVSIMIIGIVLIICTVIYCVHRLALAKIGNSDEVDKNRNKNFDDNYNRRKNKDDDKDLD